MKPEILKQLMDGEIKFDPSNEEHMRCEKWLLTHFTFHLTSGSYYLDTNGNIVYSEESNIKRSKNGDLYMIKHYKRIDNDDPGCSMVEITIYRKEGIGFLTSSNKWCRDFTKEEYDTYFGNESEEDRL